MKSPDGYGMMAFLSRIDRDDGLDASQWWGFDPDTVYLMHDALELRFVRLIEAQHPDRAMFVLTELGRKELKHGPYAN